MSRKSLSVAALLPGLILCSVPCSGQDVLSEDRISALKGLSSVHVVIRPNTPKEVVSVKELGDMVTVGLARSAPAISMASDSSTSAWLELSVITSEHGGVLEHPM